MNEQNKPLASRISYITEKSPEDVIDYGLDLKGAMENIVPEHNCNCNRCYKSNLKVYKVIITVLEEVPYQDPDTIKSETEEELEEDYVND